jgi:hypothetical protein
MEMTTLDELERLLAATQGEEWRVSNRDPVRVVDGTGAYIALCDPHHKGDPLQETRAALIVAAINALPGLIESARRVERLEAEFKKVRDLIERADQQLDETHDHDAGTWKLNGLFDVEELVCAAAATARAALKGT